MHKENIQAIVSTPRPSLIAEEKEARDQLKRAVDFHESFIQSARFLSTLQEGSYPLDKGSLSAILKNYASYFSLCGTAFEKEVSYFAEKAARKKMEVKLAAMNNFVNPTLRTPFMTADLLSPNLVSAEGARATVKAVEVLPDRVLEKAFKDPNLPMEAVRRKPTKPSLVKIPQKPTPRAALAYQHKPQPPPQPYHPKVSSAPFKKGAPAPCNTHQKSSLQGQPPFPWKDHQGGGKPRDKSTQGRKHDRDPHHRRRHWGCSGRQAPEVSGSLGRRPSFHTNHNQKRLPLGMDLRASSSDYPKADGGRSRPRRRSLQALTKEGYLQGPSTALLLGKPLQRTQSFGMISPHHRSLPTEQIYQSASLLYDQPKHSPRPHIGSLLGGFSRPPGRLPACPNQEESSQIHGLLTRPSALLLQGSSLRSQCSYYDLHKNSKVSSQPPSPGGYPRASLPRRFDHLGPAQSLSTNQSTQDYLVPRKPRLPNQLRKISAEAINRHHLARSPLVSPGGSLGRPPILQRQDHCRSKSAPPFQSSVQKMLGIFYRETSLPRPDPQAPTTKHFSSFSPPIPRPCKAQRQVGSPPKVLEGEPQDLDLPGCSPRPDSFLTTPLENRPMDRCIFIWMGRSLRQRSPLPGAMVQGRDGSACQRPGGASSDQDYRNLRPQQPTHFSPHRQRGGKICHQQPQVEIPSLIPSPIHAMSSQVPQRVNPSSLKLLADTLSRDHPLRRNGHSLRRSSTRL